MGSNREGETTAEGWWVVGGERAFRGVWKRSMRVVGAYSRVESEVERLLGVFGGRNFGAGNDLRGFPRPGSSAGCSMVGVGSNSMQVEAGRESAGVSWMVVDGDRAIRRLVGGGEIG